MDFNIEDSLENKDTSFLYNDNINQHFFNEIIVAAGLKDWNRFQAVCDLPINWFGSFTYDKEYSASYQNNEVTIDDNSSYFYNFLHVAASHFEDNYIHYILLKIIDKKDENIKEYETFKKTVKYLLVDLLSRNCIKTLNELKSSNLINSEDILEEIFVKNYALLRKNGMKLLNISAIFDHYLGNKEKSISSKLLIDANKYFKFGNVEMIPNYGKMLKLLLSDLIEYYPLEKKRIGNIFTEIIFNSLFDNNKDSGSYYHNNNVKNLVIELIAHSILDCHSPCSFNKKSLIEDVNKDQVTINDVVLTVESYFKLEPQMIEEAYQKKAMLLTNELEKTVLVKQDKKVKV